MPVPRITLWALSGTAAPSECGAPPRASGAHPRRQGWRPVTRQAALSTRWYLRRLWAWRRGRRPAAAAPAAPPMRRGGSAPAKHMRPWSGVVTLEHGSQRACRISTLGRFDGGGTPGGADGGTGMRGGMFIAALYTSSSSSSPSEPSSMGPAPSSCERKKSLTASSRLPSALCRKNWACSGGQPVRSANSATCASISRKRPLSRRSSSLSPQKTRTSDFISEGLRQPTNLQRGLVSGHNINRVFPPFSGHTGTTEYHLFFSHLVPLEYPLLYTFFPRLSCQIYTSHPFRGSGDRWVTRDCASG